MAPRKASALASSAPPAAVAGEIDLATVLKGPDGKELIEAQMQIIDGADGKRVPEVKETRITLQMMLYSVLTRPRDEDKLDFKKALELGQLANLVSQGGSVAFTTDQKKLIQDRLSGQPVAPVYGVISLLDPAMLAPAAA